MYIEKIYDAGIDGGDGLLAMILRGEEIYPPGTQFLTPESNPLQLATISHSKGLRIPVHRHPSNPRHIRSTQEVLLVRKGKVGVTVCNSLGDIVAERLLNSGDILLLIEGGHGFEILEDAEMVEIKQGPYSKQLDKEIMATPLVRSGND